MIVWIVVKLVSFDFKFIKLCIYNFPYKIDDKHNPNLMYRSFPNGTEFVSILWKYREVRIQLGAGDYGVVRWSCRLESTTHWPFRVRKFENKQTLIKLKDEKNTNEQPGRKSPNFHVFCSRFIKPLGHYTQMLWADTYKMGCGYVYYKGKSNWTTNP